MFCSTCFCDVYMGDMKLGGFTVDNVLLKVER